MSDTSEQSSLIASMLRKLLGETLFRILMNLLRSEQGTKDLIHALRKQDDKK